MTTHPLDRNRPSHRRVGISLPVQDELPADLNLQLAIQAEEHGFDVVAFGEIGGPEAFAQLGAIASRTERITLMTGVISSFTRSPALTAMGFATLEAIAPGRTILGVGAATPVIVEGWHDGSFARPIRRNREFTEAFRRILHGGFATYEGETLAVRRYRLMPDASFDVPVHIGAMNPTMLRQSGEFADGVYMAFCALDEVPHRAGLVLDGARDAGRDPDELTIGLMVNAYAGSRPEAAMERYRDFFLFYATLPTHRHNFEHAVDELDVAGDRVAAGRRRSARPLVTDEAIHRISVVGSGEDVAERVRAYWDAGVDLVTLHLIGTGRGETESAFESLAAVGEALTSIR
ncbi:MAG TPA: LLM class flavin-dependent oxidoreductase [Acidimicrobiia bacterium]|nr:LLM class flavin-dependent oxidoreductase [Acidimicrobiia bacterium]